MRQENNRECNVANGHTVMNTPDPIRTRQLSITRPGQYWGGGPPGKPFGCRWLFNTYFAHEVMGRTHIQPGNAPNSRVLASVVN